MLAQNFKTATDLGIMDDQHRALTIVLKMLETGEIKDKDLNMAFIQHACGTPSCLLGYANAAVKDCFWDSSYIFQGTAMTEATYRMTSELTTLFAIGSNSVTIEMAVRKRKATVEQAATALRSYLTTGDPNWAEALS